MERHITTHQTDNVGQAQSHGHETAGDTKVRVTEIELAEIEGTPDVGHAFLIIPNRIKATLIMQISILANIDEMNAEIGVGVFNPEFSMRGGDQFDLQIGIFDQLFVEIEIGIGRTTSEWRVLVIEHQYLHQFS
jgi:hypothetical protein